MYFGLSKKQRIKTESNQIDRLAQFCFDFWFPRLMLTLKCTIAIIINIISHGLIVLGIPPTAIKSSTD